MKQKLDEVRTLAVQMFNAGQRKKREQPSYIWGASRELQFRHLPSEHVEVLDAMACEAMKRLRP